MNSLRNLQERCYRAFLHGESEVLAPALASRAVPAPISIQVYQNNARETYRKALAASYPVIERLVGDDCFRGLAQKYMRDYPSTSGDLQSFGAALPRFLAELYTGTTFDYLPDVARLEWAIEEVQLESETDPLDLEALGRIDPGQYAELRFSGSNAARLVGSRFPILTIWRTNQPGQEADVDLQAGAEHVLVRRVAGNVELDLVSRGAAALASLLADSRTLGAVTDELAGQFDVAAALQELARAGFLSDYKLPNSSSAE